VGLSDEEIDDLAKLITSLKEDPALARSEGAFEAFQKKMEATAQHLIQLGDIILRFDRSLKSFYEILRLSHKKSEIMNERIDTLMGWATRMKERKPGEQDE
jgi:hypothetical protein